MNGEGFVHTYNKKANNKFTKFRQASGELAAIINSKKHYSQLPNYNY